MCVNCIYVLYHGHMSYQNLCSFVQDEKIDLEKSFLRLCPRNNTILVNFTTTQIYPIIEKEVLQLTKFICSCYISNFIFNKLFWTSTLLGFGEAKLP